MGADSRRPLGLCVAGGLLFSQLLTLYIKPVLYIYLDNLQKKFGAFSEIAMRGPVLATRDAQVCCNRGIFQFIGTEGSHSMTGPFHARRVKLKNS